MRRWTIGALLVLLGSPALALAHDEAKTPVSSSIILEMSKPSSSVSRDRALDEAIKSPRPAPPSRTDYQVQPDGSVKYGNTTVIIRHDCPPGGVFFVPPPLPGRRR
jgi:hypothetical protein